MCIVDGVSCIRGCALWLVDRVLYCVMRIGVLRIVNCGLRIAYCVVCLVSCVLCVVFTALCIEYCVLCIVYCVV